MRVRKRIGARINSSLALLTLVAVGACDSATPETQGGGGRGGAPRGIPVEAVAAVTDTVADAISATGAIEAVESIELRPEIEGRLTEIMVREGTEVTVGTPLFKVDDAELIHQVARLEAERDLAQQAVARARELIGQEALSPADLDEAEANARSTQAQYELQKLRLERTVVLAPFAGIVGERLVSVGDYVTTGTRLTTLQTVDPQRAAFQIPERYAERLARGQRVRFRVAAVNREFTGTVDFVDPVVQLPARTITVKARVRNPRRDLKPGMFIEANLTTEVRADAVVIPEDAILPLEGATYVWVVAEGAASRRQVGLGVRTPGFVEVLEGLEAGEVVVVGGLERLRDGAPVTVTMVERR